MASTTTPSGADDAAQSMREAIHAWLLENHPDVAAKRVVDPPPLQSFTRDIVFLWLSRAYSIGVDEAGVALATEVYDKFSRRSDTAGQPDPSMRPPTMNALELTLLEKEFNQPYIGGQIIIRRLYNYIVKCWQRHCKARAIFKFAYTSVVQSSGFGKSRLIKELAIYTNNKPKSAMKLVYLCIHQGQSSGYPIPTARWPSELFPPITDKLPDALAQHELTTRLVTLFKNSTANWKMAGEKCFDHFADPDSGKGTFKLLIEAKCDVKPTRRHVRKDAQRILVLALDEARCLLKTDKSDHLGWFRRFRRAVFNANVQIARWYGDYAGIFVILIDTNSKISDFIPPSSVDHSSRAPDTNESILFPPFVLTETMDIALDARLKIEAKEFSTPSAFYKSLVTSSLDDSRNGLVDMGRPLWQRYKVEQNQRAQGPADTIDKDPEVKSDVWDDLIQLAADKLLCGRSARDIFKIREDFARRCVTSLPRWYQTVLVDSSCPTLGC